MPKEQSTKPSKLTPPASSMPRADADLETAAATSMKTGREENGHAAQALKGGAAGRTEAQNPPRGKRTSDDAERAANPASLSLNRMISAALHR